MYIPKWIFQFLNGNLKFQKVMTQYIICDYIGCIYRCNYRPIVLLTCLYRKVLVFVTCSVYYFMYTLINEKKNSGFHAENLKIIKFQIT